MRVERELPRVPPLSAHKLLELPEVPQHFRLCGRWCSTGVSPLQQPQIVRHV
jgi:hypothetical protein